MGTVRKISLSLMLGGRLNLGETWSLAVDSEQLQWSITQNYLFCVNNLRLLLPKTEDEDTMKTLKTRLI